MPASSRTRSSSRYCVGCHNDRNKDRTSGLSFQSFDAAAITDHADVAERMIRRLRSGMMPPVGAKRPDQADDQRARQRVRDAHRSRGRAQSESGLAPVAAAQSRRIPARGEGPARGGRRRQRLSARRHAERRLRQHRRLADDFVDADGRLPARGEPDQPPGRWRSQRLADLDDLEGAAHRVADAPRRRRAARHARRPVGAARVPGRRRIPLQDHAAHGTDRRPVRRPVSRRADRSLDRRRARRVDGHQPAHERAGPERPDDADAEGQHQGRRSIASRRCSCSTSTARPTT